MVATVALAFGAFSALAASVVASPAGIPLLARGPPWTTPECKDICDPWAEYAAHAIVLCSSQYLEEMKTCFNCAYKEFGQDRIDLEVTSMTKTCASITPGSGASATGTTGSVGSDSAAADTSSVAPTTSKAVAPAASTSASGTSTGTKASAASKTIATWSFAGVAVVATLLM